MVQPGNPCSNSVPTGNDIQFFVRIISGGKTLVLRGNSEDKVYSIHEKIQSLTGIPVIEQRLVYGNKELQWDHSLSECMISNDSGLHLVARMRSACQEAWQVIDDFNLAIHILLKGEVGISSNLVKRTLMDFLEMLPKVDIDLAASFLNIFKSSSVAEALVMLYISPDKGIKECAVESVQAFLNAVRGLSPESISSQFVPIVLEMCKLFRRAAANKDPMYKLCRSTLAEMVKPAKNSHHVGSNRILIALHDMLPFASEVVSKLSESLALSMESINNLGPVPNDVHNLVKFLKPSKVSVKNHVSFAIPIPTSSKFVHQTGVFKSLYVLFDDLLIKLLMCLDTIEDLVMEKKETGGWDQYIVMLKVLHNISRLYEGAEDYFWKNLKDNKISLCHLIVRYAKRGEDYEWILEHKDLIKFEGRKHLVLLLLPEVDDGNEDLNEMLIDRSQLLVESFEYIAHAEPNCLRVGLYLEFKNEEATGPGVLREWFLLVCQEIFNPNTGLFVACPNDRRRFYPNPASTVDPMHLEYFNFAGRIIALALMRSIQVGIAFDRSFYLQLAGKSVSLEDIKDADPYLYSSCKQILDMDPLAVDQDALGLAFVYDIQELLPTKVEELCPGGENMVVNSKNRKDYVDLLIQHRFMRSVSEPITHFVKGFTDMVGEERIQKMVFRILELEDFDGMLHGSESVISLEDWKAHTDYKGYELTDPQICWFWKILGEMTPKQREVLLFFWTSIKYLPVKGFGCLGSRLSIYKSSGSIYHLPSSHTCFYQLSLPVYPSISVMQHRLNTITQDHVSYSFGTN